MQAFKITGNPAREAKYKGTGYAIAVSKAQRLIDYTYLSELNIFDVSDDRELAGILNDRELVETLRKFSAQGTVFVGILSGYKFKVLYQLLSLRGPIESIRRPGAPGFPRPASSARCRLMPSLQRTREAEVRRRKTIDGGTMKHLFFLLLGISATLHIQAAEPPGSQFQLTRDVLVGAKLQLCKGFLSSNVRYYLQTRMPQQYAEYKGLNEFEESRGKAILQEASDKLTADAAGWFTPGRIYSSDVEGHMSTYDQEAKGFWHAMPLNIWIETQDSERFYGVQRFADNKWGFDALYTLARPGRRLFESPGRPSSARPIIHVALALTDKDSARLRVPANRPAFLIPVAEAQAKAIAEIYRGEKERRTLGRVDVRIMECVQDPEKQNQVLVGEIVGLQYFVAKLEKKFFDVKPVLRRKDLLLEWRRDE